jgi:hypothetical protein
MEHLKHNARPIKHWASTSKKVWVLAAMVAGQAQAQSPAPAPSSAAPAGEVEAVRGVGFAQTPGQTPRTLGRGLALREGDRVTTAEGASAVVKLGDGTRMTVRPNSEIVLSQYRYRQEAADNSMVMELLRGGFRAITGLIAKSSPNAARVQTSTATIGIRGTDFDARLCNNDCQAETARITQRARPNTIQASAKLLTSRGGDISAVDGQGQRRRLVDGGGVYPGDLVETAQGAQAVLAFRDESRITLGAATRFRVDSYVYDKDNATDGRMLTSLLKGTVRALTGLIAKTNRRNVSFSTSTATIGIRGTELLIQCTGNCAGEAGDANDGLSVFTYAGQVQVLRPPFVTETAVLSAQQGVFISGDTVRPLSSEPANNLQAPGPIALPVSLFDSNSVNESQQGLYVFVRDGHIELSSGSQVLHLGRNEAGVATPGQVLRPEDLPRFLEFDRVPLPTVRNFPVAALLGSDENRANLVCR